MVRRLALVAADPVLPSERPLRTAHALASGVRRRELSGPLWDTRWRGVQVPAWIPASAEMRARAAALLLPPGGAVGGWAAAHLLGGIEIDGFAGDGRTELPVLLHPAGRVRPRRGIELSRSVLGPGDVVVVDGVPVTSAVRTAFDLGRRSRGLRSAVAHVDQALRLLDVGVDELTEYVRTHRRWRGTPLLRQALPLVNPRSRSWPESRLRLVWVLDAMLPAPMVNPEVRDLRGQLLGLPDLLDPDTGLVGEYDGAQHRRLEQHTDDNVREERFERVALTVVRATSMDLHGARLVHRLRAGQADAARTPRGPWRAAERPLRR